MSMYEKGRRDRPAPSIPRRDRRRKAAEDRRHGKPTHMCWLELEWKPALGVFHLRMKPDGRVGQVAHIAPHQAAELAAAITERLADLEALRDAGVPGSGVPS